MKTRRAQSGDIDAWVELRHALWPGSDLDALADRPVGFAEVALHQGSSDPYAHVEGWYVLPECRGRGYGQLLMHDIEQWSLRRAIRHLTSDTDPNYPLSPEAHARAGFRKISEFTIFMKELRRPAEHDE